MRKFLSIVFLVIAALTWPDLRVQATSIQAYQDYQFQFDQYRQRLADYQIAITQYKQFNSLASQQDALDKVKLLIAQRSTAGKAYALFLNEKLTENPGIPANELSIYRTILTNQVGFLDQGIQLAPSIASLDDAARVSEQFVNNYEAMQSAYRQTIAAVELGYLNYFAKRFDDVAVKAQALINESRSDATPQKQAVLDRWLLTLSNKHILYQQKANSIRSMIPKINGDVMQQDRMFTQLQGQFGAARQDLIESASYLKELENALKYD
ncbi:MAG: hypothetical protein AAB542_00065 [Patescibacteria group bacterium]